MKYMYLLSIFTTLNVIPETHQVYRDFSLICQNENIRDQFEDVFPQWARTIVTYCRETQLKSTAIQAEVSELESDLDDGEYCCFTLLSDIACNIVSNVSGFCCALNRVLLYLPGNEYMYTSNVEHS